MMQHMSKACWGLSKGPAACKARARTGATRKHTCHTISPFFTRWQDSMYDSAYQSEPDEVLPYLHADTMPQD